MANPHLTTNPVASPVEKQQPPLMTPAQSKHFDEVCLKMLSKEILRCEATLAQATINYYLIKEQARLAEPALGRVEQLKQLERVELLHQREKEYTSALNELKRYHTSWCGFTYHGD